MGLSRYSDRGADILGDREPGAPDDDGAWVAPVARGPLDARLTIPGSKSLTNRELVLSALAERPWVSDSAEPSCQSSNSSIAFWYGCRWFLR